MPAEVRETGEPEFRSLRRDRTPEYPDSAGNQDFHLLELRLGSGFEKR